MLLFIPCILLILSNESREPSCRDVWWWLIVQRERRRDPMRRRSLVHGALRMRIFPSRRRLVVLCSVGAILVLSAFRLLRDPHRVHDEVGIFAPAEVPDFDHYLELMHKESGVDVRLLLVRGVPHDDLERFALERARLMGLGRDDDRRGMLLVYDAATQRLRIEVGPTLEPIFTDGFLGHLMREHTGTFFASGSPSLGLRLTLFMIHHRLREAALGNEYDPRTVAFIEDSVRLARGGGATARARLDSAAAATGGTFVRTQTTADDSVRFGAQPTPADAYARYMEWLRDGRLPMEVGLFTPASRGHLARLPMSPGFVEYVFLTEYAQPYAVDERGDVAMLYFTHSPLVSPHFFHRTPEGWQMDIAAEVADTHNYVGYSYTWGMADTDDEYSRAFADRVVYEGGAMRIAGGDNRPLPSRWW